MGYTLQISDRAGKHIESAYLWYEQQKNGLGVTFLETMDATFVSIQSNPLAYGYRHKTVRGCFVERFPYLVLFYVRKSNVHILAVFHTSRNPKERFKG